MSVSPSGYSGTPLEKKLGIKSGYQCLLINQVGHYFDQMNLPEDVSFDESIKTEYDFIHAFFKEKVHLIELWDQLKSVLKKDGSLWVSWPKGSSKIETDLNGNTVRELGLQGGLVDVKVCAVDEN